MQTIFELSGVEPNPRISTVRKGVEICKSEGIEFILAVGGGSVIDCTKAIAAGAKYEGDAWDIVIKKTSVKDALPFGTVLTLAATGSEMNPALLLQIGKQMKNMVGEVRYVYPRFSILDPVNTFTVPRNQTIYGIVDMMSHTFEHYFHKQNILNFKTACVNHLLVTVIETAPKLLEDLENYEHRATMLILRNNGFKWNDFNGLSR